MDFLTPEEVHHRLTARVKEEGGTAEEWGPAIKPGWYVPIKLAIFSGLRQGEQFGLRIGGLDFHAGQVRVRQQVNWLRKKHTADGERCQFSSPKSKAGIRNVDLASDLLEDLRRYVAWLPDRDPDRLLFATREGTPLDPRNMVERVFKNALERADLRQIRWRDLRHT